MTSSLPATRHNFTAAIWIFGLVVFLLCRPASAETSRSVDQEEEEPAATKKDVPVFGHALLIHPNNPDQDKSSTITRRPVLSHPNGVFLLNYTNFNHGSFGACPKPVLEYQNQLRRQQEQQPDPFLRKHYKQLWNETRVRIAQSWKVPYQQLVLVESASTAVNSILRSVEWKSGDVILYFSTAYGMVKNTAQWLKWQYGLEIVEVPIQFPIANGNDAYLKPLEACLKTLKTNGELSKLKVAVLDHVVSIPAIKLPILALTKLIRQYTASNVSTESFSPFILVDGAHAWGQVPTEEISSLLGEESGFNDDEKMAQAGGWIDAYLSNGHKWMYSPKGSAVLWVHASRISRTFPEPTVISSENSMQQNSFDTDEVDDPLYHRFIYTSTKDYTALLSLAAAMDFRNDVLGGDVGIHTYIRNLALQAKSHLMQVWNTPIPMAPNDMEEYMINVILPISKDDENKTEVGLALQQWLYDQHDMYVVIAQEPSSGYIYTRLSAQVYLEMSDFIQLGNVVLEFLGLGVSTIETTVN
ncbi:isopenicillin-N epimerase [Nitzschia inconspicua]|uniref:Isopenicillin-N epimerase n=1 Tax=Nitzschia inconspicua TaxID=303405 RepID=A0A9K3KKR2_9STRA|nr:isopenicillin-N epimerase [Nitzschia inconspicua]